MRKPKKIFYIVNQNNFFRIGAVRIDCERLFVIGLPYFFFIDDAFIAAILTANFFNGKSQNYKSDKYGTYR